MKKIWITSIMLIFSLFAFAEDDLVEWRVVKIETVRVLQIYPPIYDLEVTTTCGQGAVHGIRFVDGEELVLGAVVRVDLSILCPWANPQKRSVTISGEVGDPEKIRYLSP